MKKAQLRNIFTKTILASSILYADSSIAAPCSYVFDSQTVGPNIVCSSTNATESPFTSFSSTLKFNGTVTIPANVIPITNTGVSGVDISAGSVNFTKAVSVTDVLTTTNAIGVGIQQGNTTMAGGVTVSNANAPLTSGIKILGDNVATTNFTIASISASNNNAYGLWISNKITSGIISGPVSISNTDHNYNGVATNVDQSYGIKVDLAATPVFNGVVTLTNNQITSGAKLGLGTGIDVKSNAYPKFNNTVTISANATSTSNTTGIQVTSAKADFATVNTTNHGLHIGGNSSTVNFSGAVTISDSGVVGLPKTGIKAVTAAIMNFKGNVGITGPLTTGVDISGASTVVTFSKDLNTLDNYNAVNITSSGKGVFTGNVTINKTNSAIINTQGISISSGSGQFDGTVSISNMDNKALNIQGASPVFNNTLTLADNKTGIYVDGTSVPVFNKLVTTNNKIVSGVFNSNNDVKISGANAKASFVGGITINNSLTGISLDTKANPSFGGAVSITQDLGPTGNTKLLPTDGILFTTSSTGTFGGAVSINNMTNRALNIQGSSPVFNNTITLADNKTGIYVDGTSVPVFNKLVTTNNKIVSGVFNSNNDVKISGANAKANFASGISLTNSLTAISLDTSANPTFGSTVDITQDLGPTGNTKLLATDGILFTTASTGKFNGAVTISNMTNRALNIQSSSPVFNDAINLADNKMGIYVDGTSTPVFQSVTSNNKIVSGVFNSNNEIKISGANAKASFTGPININNSLIGISLDTNANPTLGSVINITQDLGPTGNTKLLPTDGILFTSGATGKIDSFIIISNMTNRALNIQSSSPVFNNVIQVNDNKNDIYIDGTSVPVFNKSITSNNKIVSGVFNSNNSIKISGANTKASFVGGVFITNSATGISLDASANPTFSASINITQDLGPTGNTKLLPTDGILFTTSSTGKFDGALSISNMTNRGLNIQSSSPVFNNTITLADNKTGIYVDGTSAPVFNKSVTSGNQIVSGVFNTDTSIKISGANAKANFLGAISINNSLTGISLDTSANPIFSNNINITQDLGPTGNTKLLPTDGISIIGASIGKFDGTVTVNNMTNRGLNIQSSSPVFNKVVVLGENKIGAFIGQSSDVNFVEGISISNNSSSSAVNTIGMQVVNSKVSSSKGVSAYDHEVNILADNSTILFADVVSVADSGFNATPKTGIKLINGSNATLNSSVNINLTPSAGALNTGIDISGVNTVGTFKGLVRADNTYSAINISNGGKGIFAGTVSIGHPNLALTNLQAINISSANADFSGGVSIVGMDLPAINISKSSPSFNVTNIASSKQGILVNNNSAPTFTSSVTINRPFNHPIIPDELQTYAMTIDNNSSVTINGVVSTANINKAIVIDHGSSANFSGNIVMDDQRNFAFASNGMSLDNTSQALISKDITLTNLNGYGLTLSNNSTATIKGVLTASKIVDKALYVGIGSKITLEQAAIFSDNGTAIQFDNTGTVNSFAELLNLTNNKYDIDINNTTVNFAKAVTSNNTITSGNFVNYNSIKISGANSKGTFSSPISITNSLTGINLDAKANPSFVGAVSITQDLGPTGNTKLLPTDGILFTTSSTGTFGGAVSINNMTNRALDIQGASPVFNNSVTLLDNKSGIYVDGASAPVFNNPVNISKTDTINVPVEIGVEITNSSNPTFAGDVSVSKNKYGIAISAGSNATFGGVVNVSDNRGPDLADIADPIGVYGIKIINNSNADFKGNVVVADNYYKHIVDVNPSIGYAQVAKGVYIDDNSSASFIGSVSTSMLNHPQQLSEGIRISNNSSADFDGAVSTTSHYQGIIVDNSSKATFNNNVQMLEERLTVPLNNSSGLTVDNASEVLFNNDITANGFWRAGIEVNNGSLVNFKGVVTAKNNESPVANTAITMDFGSTAINIADSTVTFDKQPVLDNNYNAIKISGATSDVTFSTDLLFTNNKSYGINLSDVSGINFNNVTYNSDAASYFSTFFNSKSSKATFNGAVECNSGLCLKIDNASNVVFNQTFTANNTSLPSPYLLNTTAINSTQSTQLVFNKAVDIDNFYIGINSTEDDYISFSDTVNITNNKGFGINLNQPQLAEFKKSVNIEGELKGFSSPYGINIAGYFGPLDPHQVIFSGTVDVKDQFIGISLQNSNVEFQKAVNVESQVGQSNGYGIHIAGQTNDSSLNKVVFSDDVTIKNQYISGLYLEKNNTVFNGNVTIEDSYHSLFSNATVSATTNPTPIFNKNVTINNGTNGIVVTGGELIFNGPVVINKSSSKGMYLASGGYNNENSKLYFNDTVEVNDCVVGINTYNEFASNYLIFEKGLTINNPNIPANSEVEMGFDDYITFNGDSAVNAKIQGGIVTFTGAPTISRTIEDAQIVDFTLSDSSKRLSLVADIGGTDIYTNAVKIGIDSNITFTGNLQADNTIFDLSTKILTIDGSFTHGTNPVAKFASFALTPVGGITIDTYYDGTNAGHFEFATPSTVIDLSNSSKMIINITEATGLPVLLPGQTRQFDLFVGNGVSNFQLIDANNITISTNNPLSKWTIDTQEGILYQSLKTDGVGNMFKMVDSDGVTDPLMNSDDFVQELVDIIMDKGPIAGADALNKIGNPDAVIAASAPLSNIETGIIDTRLSSVIGAGDEEPIYGAWIAPLYGKATQKEREGQPGFRSTYFGGIIGFDSKIDDYLSVGVAAGISSGKLNHTDSNKGDRTDHKAYVGIIYLSYDLTERWMLQNTFSYGFSRVHNKEIRISTPNNKIARAKYDERRISDNIGLGYKTLLSNEMLLIPFIALDFNRIGSIKYTETGADIQNLKFSRSSLMEVDGIIGARLSRNFQYEDFVITPAVVANVRYAISGQDFVTDVRLAADDTIQIVPKTVAPARQLYRLGASVNINNKDKDFLINYEFRKAEKFTSHQGSLKIQISF